VNLEIARNWSKLFDAFFAPFGALFSRSESRLSARQYVRGLLSEVKRKTSWQVAEAVGLRDPHALQRLLYEVPWDADTVCGQMRHKVIKQLGYEPGIGVIDESGFVKKGDQSAGVGGQYCGRVGKVENCQVGVFLSYATPLGAAFLDRALYIPQHWFEDRERCRAAKIPDEVVFQTKPQIAQMMLEQAWREGIPMQWVVTDSLYGNSPPLRNAIHQAGRSYVLGIGSQHQIQRADGFVMSLSSLIESHLAVPWDRLCFQLSEKGAVWYEWRAWRIYLPNDAVGEQWLLVQRHPDHPDEYRCYLSNAPLETSLIELAGVALTRHSIEQLLEEAKGETGLADYQVRHWQGWYRHITLSLLAHTFLKLIQHEQREKKPVARLVEFECAGAA
jgi:SRSO17 transposase